MLDPFSAERPEDVDHLKRVQADIHAAFIDWVKQRRGPKLTGTDEELFSGAFWAGSQAAAYGLVDGVGDLRAVSRQQFGDKVRLRLVNPPPRRRFGLPWSKAPTGPAAWLEELAEAIDQRALWSRYGL